MRRKYLEKVETTMARHGNRELVEFIDAFTEASCLVEDGWTDEMIARHHAVEKVVKNLRAGLDKIGEGTNTELVAAYDGLALEGEMFILNDRIQKATQKLAEYANAFSDPTDCPEIVREALTILEGGIDSP